jgi:hypothetical protein
LPLHALALLFSALKPELTNLDRRRQKRKQLRSFAASLGSENGQQTDIKAKMTVV